MSLASADLPSDPDALRAFALACQSELAAATAELQAAKLAVQLRTLEIEKLKFQIAKLRRMQFGRSSERLARHIEQLELRLEELEAGEAEEISKAAAEDQPLPIRQGARPKRKPLPDHLPRQEIVHEPEHDGGLHLSRLRRRHGPAWRRRHRGPRLYPRPVPGDPPCPAEIRLPALRRDHPGAGAIAADAARSRRPRHAGASAGLEILRSSAAVPAERDLCPRRPRPRPLDPERLGRPGGLAAAADRRRHPQPRLRRREGPRRRHAGPGAGAWPRPHPDRTIMGLCPRRPAVLRSRAAGGGLLLQPRSRRRASGQPISRTSPAFCRPMPIAGSQALYEPRKARPGLPAMPAITEVACWAHCRRNIFDVWEATKSTGRQGGARPDRPVLRHRGQGPLRPASRAAGASHRYHPLARCVLHLGTDRRAQALGPIGTRRGAALHHQAPHRADPLCHRRPPRSRQQHRRKCNPLHRLRKTQLALRRQSLRRRACRRDVLDPADRETERRQPGSLSDRYPRQDRRRASDQPHLRTDALGLSVSRPRDPLPDHGQNRTLTDRGRFDVRTVPFDVPIRPPFAPSPAVARSRPWCRS